jgi:hypothetical protein
MQCTTRETKPVIPKDEGLGVMLSTFVLHEFGYGMPLLDEDLKKVNGYSQMSQTQQ